MPLAKIAGCTQGNISQLVRRGSLLPVRFVLAVEAATGVSRHALRPDIYPLSSQPNGHTAPSDLAADPAPVACDQTPKLQPEDIA